MADKKYKRTCSKIIECYEHGMKIGEMYTREASEALGVPYSSVREGLRVGSVVMGKYTFRRLKNA